MNYMILLSISSLFLMNSCGNVSKTENVKHDTDRTTIISAKRVGFEDLIERAEKFHTPNGELFTGGTMDTFDNGNILSAYFLDGYRDGLWECKDAYGKFLFRRNYKNGKQDGIEEMFDNGKLKERKNFREGNLHGEYELFFENGQIAEAGVYELNNKYGEWNQYFSDGSIKQHSVFVSDGIDSWELYNSAGKMWKRMYSKQDGMHKIEEYDPPIESIITKNGEGSVSDRTNSMELVDYITQQESIHDFIKKGYEAAYSEHLNYGKSYNYRRLRNSILQEYPEKINRLQWYVHFNSEKIRNTTGLERRVNELVNSYKSLYASVFEN